MIRDSINYLRNSDDWVKTVVIGGVLTLLGVLIVPMLVVFGYVMRVVRETMTGEEEPPVFDEWGELTVDGLKAFVIAAVYSLVPVVIAGIFGGIGLVGILTGASADSGGIAALGGVVALVGLLVAFVLGLVAAYITPAALANYAETDRVGAAFSVSDLRPVLTSGKYATAWLTALVVVIGSGFVTAVLTAIPILGAILAPFIGAFVGFYAFVAAYYIIGTTWGELHAVEMAEGETPGEQAAV